MVRSINNLRNKKGFTLIELIVVLAVLAVIMAIAVPRFIGVQDQAKIKADENSENLVKKAAELYFATENDSDNTVTIAELQSEGYLGEVDFNNITVSNITIVPSTGVVTVNH